MCLKNDFHFTCLGTKKFLHLLPLLVVLDPNPKVPALSDCSFFGKSVYILTPSKLFVNSHAILIFEYQELLNIIAHNVYLFAITSGFKDELSLWLMKTHDLVNSLSIMVAEMCQYSMSCICI